MVAKADQANEAAETQVPETAGIPKDVLIEATRAVTGETPAGPEVQVAHDWGYDHCHKNNDPNARAYNYTHTSGRQKCDANGWSVDGNGTYDRDGVYWGSRSPYYDTPYGHGYRFDGDKFCVYGQVYANGRALTGKLCSR